MATAGSRVPNGAAAISRSARTIGTVTASCPATRSVRALHVSRSADDDFDQTARRPEFRNWTERGFTILDRNRDGRIQRAEWFYNSEGFIRADSNRDGVLTRAEFLGGEVDADREDRFDYLDVNNDGRVERSEWHAQP